MLIYYQNHNLVYLVIIPLFCIYYLLRLNDKNIEIKMIDYCPIKDPKFYNRDVLSNVQYLIGNEPNNELLFFWEIIKTIEDLSLCIYIYI